MEPILIFVSLLAIVIYLFQWKLTNGKIKGLPEPPGNILFGHTFKLITGCLEQTLLNWKLTHGQAFQIRIFHLRMLVLGSKSAISECFSLPQASGRPRLGMYQFLYEKFGEGPTLGEGPEYDEQRLFLSRELPVHGEGRQKLGVSIRAELNGLMDEWRNRRSQVVDLDGITGAFAINSYWNVLGGKKYSVEDLRKVALALERLMGVTTWKQKIQLLFHHILLKIGLTKADTYANTIAEISLDLIKEREKTRIPGNPRNIIDKMLDKRDKTTDPKSAYHQINAHQAFRLAEFWAASSEVTTRTIEYLILLMSQHPETVDRIRQEILDVVGPEQEPETCHWELMPFSAACVTEVVRMFPAGVLGVPHKAMQDFEFRGSVIPKGTIIFANIWGVNHDPQVWVRPTDFNPSRFLNSDGQLDASMRSQVVSFSLGRRQCLGRQMSLDAIFLFLVTAFRQFNFESVGPVDFGYKYEGTSLAPKDGHRIRIVPFSRA